jgi:8-oxo-dGTP diphosphatase
MRDRSTSAPAKTPTRRAGFSVDLVLLTPHGKQLAVMLNRSTDPRAREKWSVPYDLPRIDETLEAAADRLARSVLSAPPTWLEQIGAFSDGRRHPADIDLSVGYVGLVPLGIPAPVGGIAAWFPMSELPPLAPRQRSIVDAANERVRDRLDQAPVAFRLLPPTFTLSELQSMYELLLGRRLHKASFRRALQGAWLVEPTEEWRSEGRGRPAQLFRYAPRRRRSSRRGVRFELLG